MNTARLQPVRDAAESRERDALQRMAEAQRTLAEQEVRLRELRRYLAEYAAEGSRRALSPALVANRHAFLGRLQDALRHQEQVVLAAQADCEAQRARLLLATRDTAVLAQLAACYLDRERQAADRIAQRELDELALRRHQPGADG